MTITLTPSEVSAIVGYQYHRDLNISAPLVYLGRGTDGYRYYGNINAANMFTHGPIDLSVRVLTRQTEQVTT